MTYISRKEAAEMLHVHPQTISNYIKAGVVRRDPDTVNNVVRVFLEDIEKLLPDIHDLEEAGCSAEQLRKELETEKERLAEAIGHTKREIAAMMSFPHTFQSRIQMVLSIVRTMSSLTDNPLTERETNILEEMLMFHPMSEIADRYGLTYERIRIIANRALRRFNRYVVAGYADEIRMLREENARLKKEVSDRKKELAVLDTYREIDETKDKVAHVLSEEPDIVKRFLDTRFIDLTFTVRTYNCMKCNGMDTVRDLLKHSRKDVARFRHLGKKSLAELDDFLQAYGMEWGCCDEFGMMKKPLTEKQIVLLTQRGII